MRKATYVLVMTACLSVATTLIGEQPEVVHGQIITQPAGHGLEAALTELKRDHTTPLWVGYSIPVIGRFSTGWNSDQVVYLEGDHNTNDGDRGKSDQADDHAFILLQINGGSIEKLRVESPDRRLDVGGLQLIWIPEIAPDDSVHALVAMAHHSDSEQLRNGVLFAISLHDTATATQALVGLAGPNNELGLREKAAFWLACQRGHDGLAAIQRFTGEDTDAKFREKLTFDLTLAKDPAALSELIRMAHEDTSPRVRRQAQFWMATKCGKVVADDLQGLAANDPDVQLRKSAVFALSRLPKEEAVPQLIHVAESSKDPEVRRQAVFWLGQSDDSRALQYLTQLFKQ
jgi:HEAT repeats